MKNIVDVMKQKEREIQQKQQEIGQIEADLETLRSAARLLTEDGETIARTTASHVAAARPTNGEVKQFP
jgi:formate dehydrogenase assembly factor FdhD